MGDRHNKMVIGICDDDYFIHEKMKKLLITYEEKNEIVCNIQHFNSGKELLFFSGNLDMLFLDIDMPELDGIETARVLNDRGIDYKIILLTSKQERFKEGYKIGAFRFVTKPIREDELFESIDDVRKRMLGIDKIKVYQKGKACMVEQREICYIQSDGAQTLIFTKYSEYRSEESLKYWISVLDERLFCQVHRSYVVNMSQIKVLGNELVLFSEDRIPVSRRKRSVLEDAFMKFDTQYKW